MKQVILSIIYFTIQTSCYCQVEFNQCSLFEEFFSEVHFDDIPYFITGIPEPQISIDEAKDSLIEIFDLLTSEITYVNHKTLIQQQWKKFNESNKYVRKRDLKSNSFHLVNTNVELTGLDDIKSILVSYWPDLSIDTSSLRNMDSSSRCDSIKIYNTQNFIFDRSFSDLSKEESHNLRGVFRFGSVILTEDGNYAIITYDIYHKWISSNGEATGMETGGRGIIVISLINEQKIKHIRQLSEY